MATIRQIEIFLQLAEELHFGKTAALLNISQAALSKEINALEESLSCRLFNRSDKWNIRLTHAGKAYKEHVKKLPEMMALAQEQAIQAFRGESGEIAISVANMVYDYLQLGDVLRGMHARYPHVKIRIRDCQASPHVYEQIKSGEADIGFMAVNNLGNPMSDLICRNLLELPIMFAIPADHVLANKKNLQIGDFKQTSFILPPREQIPWLRTQFDTFFQEQCGTLPLVEQEALGPQATRQLVSAGLGVGLAVKPPTVDERENIVYREVEFPLKRIIVTAWNESNQSRILKNFLKLLNKNVARQTSR